ncbi:MAG: hypothetical protein R6W76_03940 [Caldilinea sp.]
MGWLTITGSCSSVRQPDMVRRRWSPSGAPPAQVRSSGSAWTRRTVTAAMLASDLVLYLTPLTFGGYSFELKKALDHSICLVSPFFTRIGGEVHHLARYNRYPAILGVGVNATQQDAQEAIFARLIERNAINLHAPAHGAVAVRRADAVAPIATALEGALARMEIRQEVTV